MKTIWKTQAGEILKKGERNFTLINGEKTESEQYNALLAQIKLIRAGKLKLKEELLKKVG